MHAWHDGSSAYNHARYGDTLCIKKILMLQNHAQFAHQLEAEDMADVGRVLQKGTIIFIV
jgi:hypothetical protein